MRGHLFDAVLGEHEGRLPLVELPFDVKKAFGSARRR
jgi:hypothetical protein